MSAKESPRWGVIIEFLERLAQQRHILALRDGMLGAVPIILVGSTFLLLGAQSQVLTQYFDGGGWGPNLVDTALGRWYLANFQDFYVPYRLTMGLMALYIAFTVAASLAKGYDLPPIPQGLGALAAFLVTESPHLATLPSGGEGWVLSLRSLGPEGVFVAIVVAILTVELARLCSKWGPGAPKEGGREEAQLEERIPPAVREAFVSFLPMLLAVSGVWLLRHAWAFDIHAAALNLMAPIARLGDSLGAVLVSNLFLHLFAVAGIHGISIINAIMLPLWQQFVAANAEAHAAGLPLPHVTAYPFYQWFIWIGGSGATLAPTLLLWFFPRQPHFRRVAKMALVPAFFNVNEPFLFGLPVIANPLLAIPCLLAPLACGFCAWVAVSSGWVQAPFIEVPWVMPGFLGAWLSTQDWRSLLLFTFNFFLSGLIWYPFLRWSSASGEFTPSSPSAPPPVEKEA